eukprot:825400-Pyramimonas_sp.AAC.1
MSGTSVATRPEVGREVFFGQAVRHRWSSESITGFGQVTVEPGRAAQLEFHDGYARWQRQSMPSSDAFGDDDQ